MHLFYPSYGAVYQRLANYLMLMPIRMLAQACLIAKALPTAMPSYYIKIQGYGIRENGTKTGTSVSPGACL